METEPTENQKKTDIQEEILLAALTLFAKKGYFNTSLTDIKDQVGLKSTSAIYQHFKNKQIIANSLHEQILDSLSISIDDIRRRNKKPVEQLRELVDLFFTLTDTAPEIMTFLILIKVDEFLPEAQPVLETPAFLKISKIFQAGIKANEIKVIKPEIAYARFFGVINQNLVMVLNGTLQNKAEDYQEEAWATAWSTIAKR